MPYADNEGVRIYWEEEGSGSPILLIMGLGYTLDMWARLRPILAQSYRVVMFDNRGVGRSDLPEQPFTMIDMAKDAAAVLDASGIDRAHIFGVSMGGMIAQELALAVPDRVVSLVLACTSHGGPEARQADQEVLEILGARAGMSPEQGVRAMVPYIYDPNTPRERVERDLEIRLSTYPPREGYLAQLQAISGHNTCDRLGGINVPTLVMLEHASHIMFTDQPERAVGAITDFLEEVTNAMSEH